MKLFITACLEQSVIEQCFAAVALATAALFVFVCLHTPAAQVY